ncbi:MAG TPA: sugar phosphate isomerase/epimerase [Terriglobia bacterium]|nr:sugar phosphate isomerase/epimerase [Terriglobia bacterium]
MANLTRRDLIGSCLSGLSALALAGRNASALTASQRLAASGGRAPSSRFSGIQIGCMTWSFREQPISEALQSIVRIGFSSVELWSGHLDPFKSSDEEIIAWRKHFADAGVKITSYFVTFDEKASDAQIVRNFQAGRLLGVSILSSNVPKSMLPRISRACQKFRMYAGLHNEVYGRPEPDQVQFPSDYAEVFRKYPRWIGATLDVGHLYAAGYDPVQFIQQYQQRIVSIHLKDENRVLPHYTDFPFGKGPTPLVPILHTLRQLHFGHPANIEWGVQNVDPVKGVAEALKYVKQALTA